MHPTGVEGHAWHSGPQNGDFLHLKDNINDPFFSYFKHELLLKIYSNWDQ